MKKSKKKKMSYGHGGGYNKPMQKAKKGMKYKNGGKPKSGKKRKKDDKGIKPTFPSSPINKAPVRTGPVSPPFLNTQEITSEMRKKLEAYLKQKKEESKMRPFELRKGGKLKKVNSKKNPGLAKLPTEVRNKMGYMAKGGKMDETMGSMARHGMKMKKAPGGMKMQGMKDRRRMMNNMMTYMGGGKMKTTYKSGGTYRQLD